jgi:hypothetical protein
MYVGWLITQRSQVQILPPLPKPEAGPEQGSGLWLVVCAQRLTVAWSAENVGLVSKIGDDLQLAAESLNVGGQGLYLALL